MDTNFEYLFLLMGYGLGILESGNSHGWLIIGFSLFVMIAVTLLKIKFKK